VMGGAAGSCLRMLTVSRAAHRALHIHVERHGIRAATDQQHFDAICSAHTPEQHLGTTNTTTHTRERHRRTQDAA